MSVTDRFDSGPVLAGLKDFQLKTVRHVERQFFERDQRRFLVADEVGLGKTLVARGLVARTIERLQAEGVARIDVVYICSNQEIARQNLRRLNVLGRDDLALPSRLTLLPRHVDRLDEHAVNFISFTPATSFETGFRTGWAEERALIYLMLRGPWSLGRRKGPRAFFQVNAPSSFGWYCDEIERYDETLADRFVARDAVSALRADVERLSMIAARRALHDGEREERNQLIGALRTELASVCADALEPDLVILDEFQRFSQLLDGESEAAALAHQLFDFENERGEFARTLLLSATPYKTFSGADDDGSHHVELERVLRFLFRNDGETDEVGRLLAAQRDELLRARAGDGEKLLALRGQLQQTLSKVMVRTERLATSATRNGMLETFENEHLALGPRDVSDLVDIARLHKLLRDRDLLKSSATVMEYWKSAPWLTQFMDGYQFKSAIVDALSREGDDALADALAAVRAHVNWDAFRSYGAIDVPNPRTRQLITETVDDAWNLLWVAPSMPYLSLDGPFEASNARSTKRLVFSAWNVAPRAIAGAASYEAERLTFTAAGQDAANTPEGRVKLERRLLDFRIDNRPDEQDRMASMPILSLVTPSASLAALVDPLEAARELGPDGKRPSQASVRDWAETRVDEVLGRLDEYEDPDGPQNDQRWYWAAPILLDRELEPGRAECFWTTPDLAARWSGGDRVADNWRAHVVRGAAVFHDGIQLGGKPGDLPEMLARSALGGFGNVALRALGREFPGGSHTQHLIAAAHLAWGLRRVFNSPEGIAVVDTAYPADAYWKSCLDYALAGDLQAVMDEWVHVLAEDAGAGRGDDQRALATLVERASAALGVGATSMRVDRIDGEQEPWRSHFAVRYGAMKQDGGQDTTHPEAIRRAFNSPFRPFVLASTSVGQEGLDFHSYCHAVVHWNVPSNPVDLEQREGRVHRYKGHAVRRNVAAEHGSAALASGATSPWAKVFELAVEAREEGQDDLVPYWLFPGESVIERHVPALPFSRDADRLDRVRRQVMLYRMAFGQPRQDDLIEFLTSVMTEAEAQDLAEAVRVDLSPPA